MSAQKEKKLKDDSGIGRKSTVNADDLMSFGKQKTVKIDGDPKLKKRTS